MNHIADNHDALLDYLYDEGDPADRLKIAQHLQECVHCSVAVLEFQNVRGMLRDWTPPSANLGFRVVQDSPAPAPPRAVWMPARFTPFAQAAAAVLLFLAGMAVSQLRVDYGGGALTLRTRASAPATPAAGIRTASIALPAGSGKAGGQVDLDALERELRARLETPSASTVDTEQLLQRVRAMIDQSEQRQQHELALRLSQVSREVDTQHQADVLRIQQDFGQQQEALEYLVRTSGGTK